MSRSKGKKKAKRLAIEVLSAPHVPSSELIDAALADQPDPVPMWQEREGAPKVVRGKERQDTEYAPRVRRTQRLDNNAGLEPITWMSALQRHS